MSRTLFVQRVGAAVLVAVLLLPSAAMARGLRPLPLEPKGSVLAVLRHFVSSLFSGDKADNQGTIDPDGLHRTGAAGENGSQIDPDGLTGTQGDNRSQIDPNG